VKALFEITHLPIHHLFPHPLLPLPRLPSRSWNRPGTPWIWELQDLQNVCVERERRNEGSSFP